MMDNVLHEHLQQSKLFANVSLESVEHLFDGCERRKLERGDHLLEAGAANTHLYLILGGELRVYLQGRDLPEQAVLARGDCVGEMSLLDGQAGLGLGAGGERQRSAGDPARGGLVLVDCSHGVARNLLAIISGRVRDSNQALVAMQERSLEFEEAGSVDALTGIHNRRWLLDAFPRAMARCERDGKPLCGRWTRPGQPRPDPDSAAAYRQAVDAQRRLADADRHALAFLAAGADARIERHVVADHRDAHHGASGPLPISVAPLTGVVILPFSIR
jgi:CRP-like cAMP-binding protein